MLSNSIALIAVSALFGVEAWKANGGPARLVLMAFAVAFALSGVFLNPLAVLVPRLGTLVADTFSQPAAWFILMVALFFVVRPLWSQRRPAINGTNSDQPSGRTADPFQGARNLGAQAINQAGRISDFRATSPLWRSDLPPFEPLIHDSMALLISFGKMGFAVPEFATSEGERIAVGLEYYFVTMSSLLRQGHADVAQEKAAEISQNAESLARNFDLNKWWTKNEW